MKNLLILILLFISTNAFSKGPQDLFKQGNDAYINKDYKTAINNYESILKEDFHSAAIYFNLGNAYFKSNNLGKAIANYEKAKKLDPENEDIKFNLQAANQKTIDKTNESEDFFLFTWWASFLNLLSLSGWAILNIAFLIITLAAFTFYIVSNKRSVKILSFTLGMTFTFFFLTTFVVAKEKNKLITGKSHAVIVNDVVTAKSAPVGGSDLFIIHEGSKVKVLDKNNNFLKIKLSKESVGWIPASSAEVI